jgi:transcriptional regulator GlxA family with amidase domain
MSGTRMRTEAARFGILVYDGVEPIDIGATYGVLSMARRVLPRIEMVLVAEAAGIVRLAGGMQVVADRGYADCPPLDALIVCGGAGWAAASGHPATLRFLREAPSAILASVCTGAMLLAAAGRLDGRAATTRRMALGAETASPLEAMRDRYPAIAAVEARLVDAGTIVTGGGVSLAIDVTLHLLQKLYGEDAAAEVARILEYRTAWQANKDGFAARSAT